MKVLLPLALLLVMLGAAQAPLHSFQEKAAGKQDQASAVREVILATQRNRRLHVFDADTLQPLGYFTVNKNAHAVTASPDGRRLYLQQPMPPAENGCCALCVLDLTTGELCKLIFPAGPGVSTPDGRWLFTQRGNVGIEVFDAKTSTRLPKIDAPGFYSLYPSPDSRWLFGATNHQRGFGPSLDIFNLETSTLTRRLPMPDELRPVGAWQGNRFYLYAFDGKQGNLWRITPETTSLDAPLKFALPGFAAGKPPIHHNLIAGGENLFLYEPFGHKLDRRERDQAVFGGVFAIEASSGKVLRHLAPSVHFARVLAGGDGRVLYGLDSGLTEWRGPVRLLKLDAASGDVLAERALETDVWSITLAKLPAELVPRGEVQPAPCKSRRE